MCMCKLGNSLKLGNNLNIYEYTNTRVKPELATEWAHLGTEAFAYMV